MRENMIERMIKQFIEMVKIDSESGNEEKMIDYLLKRVYYNWCRCRKGWLR